MPIVMNREEIVDIVSHLAAEQAGINCAEVGLNSHLFNDLNFDSLDTVDFVMNIEDRFDIGISDERAEGVKTVGDAVDLLCQLLDDRPNGA